MEKGNGRERIAVTGLRTQVSPLRSVHRWYWLQAGSLAPFLALSGLTVCQRT